MAVKYIKSKKFVKQHGWDAYVSIEGEEGSEVWIGVFGTPFEADEALNDYVFKALTKESHNHEAPDTFVMEVPEDETEVLASVALLELSSPVEMVNNFLKKSEHTGYNTLFQGGSRRFCVDYKTMTGEEAEALLDTMSSGGQSEGHRTPSSRTVKLYRENGRFRAALTLTYYYDGYEKGKLRLEIEAEERYSWDVPGFSSPAATEEVSELVRISYPDEEHSSVAAVELHSSDGQLEQFLQLAQEPGNAIIYSDGSERDYCSTIEFSRPLHAHSFFRKLEDGFGGDGWEIENLEDEDLDLGFVAIKRDDPRFTVALIAEPYYFRAAVHLRLIVTEYPLDQYDLVF